MASRPIQRLGFSTIRSSSDAYVDIVFVHGLEGHPKDTWTKTTSKPPVFWPLGLLSENPRLEHARILTWGYNTRPSWVPFRAINQQDIDSHADDLMVALQAERSEDLSRPLIFVCHSLGGILVKIVLDKSRWKSPPSTEIYNSTRGIIFLGTPHRGSNWADIAINLIKWSNLSFGSRLLLGLRLNSQTLNDLNERFVNMLENRQFGIYSFAETLPMVGFLEATVVVPQESAKVGYIDEEFQSIDGNHLEICKFDNTEDSQYQKVQKAILTYIGEIERSGPRHKHLGRITAVSRTPSHLHVFACGNDGQVYTTWWTKHSGWQPEQKKWKYLGGDFAPGAKVTAVSRHSEQLDLFVCDPKGCIKSAWWNERVPEWSSLGGWVPAWARNFLYGGLVTTDRITKRLFAWGSGEEWGSADLEGWVKAFSKRFLPSGLVSTDWQQVGEGFPAGADVAAVACKEDRLDLFVCGKEGQVYTSWWTKSEGSSEDKWEKLKPLHSRISPGAKITAVAQPNSELIDLFVCDADGSVRTSRRDDGLQWLDWRAIGPEKLFPGEANVAAVARKEGCLDLFVCGNDGQVYTSSWMKESGWQDHWKTIQGHFPPGAKIEVVAWSSERLELFVCDADGNIKTSHRHGGTEWTNWLLVSEGFTKVADMTAVSRTEEGNVDLFVSGSREQEEYGFWWKKWGMMGWDSWNSIGNQSILC